MNRTKTRTIGTHRLVIQLFTILSLFLFIGCGKQLDSFQFVFMTDIHLQPEQQATEGFKQAINKVNEIAPDFIITGGDLIMDALGQSYDRATQLYNLYNETVKDFTMPVYNTLGNHEVFGLYKSSGISPDHPDYGKKMYQRLLNKDLYYSFDYKGWHFIILDAIGFTENRRYTGEVDAMQLQWLKDDLQNIDTTTPIAVSLHIPLASIHQQMREGATAAFTAGGVVGNSLEVLEILKDYNLKLVLQGHLHIVEDVYYKGTHFITGGAVCGSWWSGAYDGFEEGFVVIDIVGDEISWRYESYGWQAAGN